FYVVIVFHFIDVFVFFFSSKRRHTRSYGDWSSDVCSSDLFVAGKPAVRAHSRFGTDGRLPGDERQPAPLDPLGVLFEPLLHVRRSEERRVGKAWRSGWWRAV